MKISRLLALFGLPLLVAACAPADDDTVDLDDPAFGDTIGAPMTDPADTDMMDDPMMAGMEGTVAMTSLNDSGVTGEANFTASGEQTEVMVTVTGAPADGTHPSHVHEGTCEAQGDVVAPVGDIAVDASGSGSVTATLDLPLEVVMNGGHYIQAHGGDGTPVVCGNIPSHSM